MSTPVWAWAAASVPDSLQDYGRPAAARVVVRTRAVKPRVRQPGSTRADAWRWVRRSGLAPGSRPAGRMTRRAVVRLRTTLMHLNDAKRTPLWWDDLDLGTRRDPLPGDTTVDVAIIGGGFTGLWTAYYLAGLEPTLNIVVLERQYVGYGASGRNGGWCHAAYPLGLTMLVKDFGRERGVEFERALNGAVAEVGRVTAAESIDCHYQNGGRILVARSELHLARAKEEAEEYRSFGFSEDDMRFVDASEASAMLGADGVLGGTYSPHAASLQPAALARGLAAACERRGVRVHEGTTVLSYAPGSVTTDRGVVKARYVVRATEAYTPQFGVARRKIAPLYSHMIATEPLPESVWAELGLQNRPTFADYSPSLIYGQRTHDGRLAFGGRGAPYHWRSGVADEFDVNDAVHVDLVRVLKDFFPALDGFGITHRWGGPLGVSRDWRPSVSFSHKTGVGFAGGYVGEGVAASNLAGRTLADLMLQRGTELSSLAWVNHAWRDWEPEPLRYVGINAGLWLAKSADREEQRTGKSSWLGDVGDWLRGKRG